MDKRILDEIVADYRMIISMIEDKIRKIEHIAKDNNITLSSGNYNFPAPNVTNVPNIPNMPDMPKFPNIKEEIDKKREEIMKKVNETTAEAEKMAMQAKMSPHGRGVNPCLVKNKMIEEEIPKKKK